MEQYLWFIPLGFVIGAFGTLIGVGGGFVLVPVLLLMYPNGNPETITAISLAVVFCNALSGSGAYARMRRIDFKSALLFSAATIPGAILGALTTAFIPRRLFNGVFGLFMILVSVFLLIRPTSGNAGEKNNSPRYVTRHLTEADGTHHIFSFNPIIGVAISFFVGYVSSLLGIGGGIIHVPVLVHILSFPVHIATATSHLILAIMAFAGTIVHVVTGAFYQGVRCTIFLAVGVLVGAQLGARLSVCIHGDWIIRGLAIALGFVGIRIFFMALQFFISILLPLKLAFGTSSATIVITALFSVTGYILNGIGRAGLPEGSLGFVDLQHGVALAVGSLLLARVGAYVSFRTHPHYLKKSFALFVILISIYVLMKWSPTG